MGGYEYVRKDGSLKDHVLITLIMQEFRTYLRDSEIYGESVEAISNQYFNLDYDTGCQGRCDSIAEQLLWMDDIELFRGKPTE